MKRFLQFFLVSISLLSCGCSGREEAKKIALFEERLQSIREEYGNVSMQVVVVKDNSIVYSSSFGLKNIETSEPLSNKNLFRIASISKSFTTTSLLQLVEKGVVSLSEDVSNIAGFVIRNPKYPDIPITLEMLLSHTSSLNDNEGYFTLDVINPAVNPDWTKCYNDYAPGEGYEYCNLNLNLAGTFLERLSGERFDLYVRRHILEPLGLYGGYCVDSLDASLFASLYESYDCTEMADDTVVPREICLECVDSEAYAPRSERIKNYHFGYDTPVFSPTGGMKLSALSLAQYMLVHINYGTSPDGVYIISEESARNMQTPRSDDEHYGLTLWHTDKYSPEVILIGHTGSAYGMCSAMFFNPEEKYGFVVISGGANKEDIITPVMQLLYKSWITGK